jgi:hypothetical protein
MRQDIQRPPMRLSQRHERWLYAIGALIFVSGLGWLGDHYLFAGSAEFGDAHAPFEPLWLRLHGAAAMAGLVVWGSVFPGHIARAWHLGVNRRSGLLMLSLVVLLVVSGWSLYYISDEDTRPWISMVHWLAGIVAGAGLGIHVWLGKRRIQSRQIVASSEPRGIPATSVAMVAANAESAREGEASMR